MAASRYTGWAEFETDLLGQPVWIFHRIGYYEGSDPSTVIEPERENLYQVDKQGVYQNIGKMQDAEEGGMRHESFAAGESMGGNASSFNRFPCSALNFLYDDVDGRFVYFGNPQEIPRDLVRTYKNGCLIMATNHPRFSREAVKELRPKSGLRRVGEYIRDMLGLSPDLELKSGADAVVELRLEGPTQIAKRVMRETAVEYNEKYGFLME